MKPVLLKLAVASTCLLSLPARAALYITIVQGLGGMPEYDEKFEQQRADIAEASAALSGSEYVSVFSGEEASRDALLSHFTEQAAGMTEEDRAAIYLIGHGSFDGDEHKFNIPGLDISTSDLNGILAELPGGPNILLSTASTSGAMLEPLAGERRILITATRNGNERNATEFGTYLARALASESADLNKNGYVSVEEAFAYAERETAGFYEANSKLATEHPQLNGDGADRFNLARLTADSGAGSDDPELRRLQEQRQSIDAAIEDLQLRRDELSTEEYNQQLRELILESARIGEQIDALNGGGGE